jgi:hypothetical protein
MLWNGLQWGGFTVPPAAFAAAAGLDISSLSWYSSVMP